MSMLLLIIQEEIASPIGLVLHLSLSDNQSVVSPWEMTLLLLTVLAILARVRGLQADSWMGDLSAAIATMGAAQDCDVQVTLIHLFRIQICRKICGLSCVTRGLACARYSRNLGHIFSCISVDCFISKAPI